MGPRHDGPKRGLEPEWEPKQGVKEEEERAFLGMHCAERELEPKQEGTEEEEWGTDRAFLAMEYAERELEPEPTQEEATESQAKQVVLCLQRR